MRRSIVFDQILFTNRRFDLIQCIIKVLICNTRRLCLTTQQSRTKGKECSFTNKIAQISTCEVL